MLIHEIIKETGLTKKAIAYYIRQGIIQPEQSENGYRIFTNDDAAVLKQVAALRRLSLDLAEIKKVLADKSGEALRKIVLKRELRDESAQAKTALLLRLAKDGDYAAISSELEAISASETILEKLLFAFPGYYGRMLALHFSPYLYEPVETDAQRKAAGTIIDFLDNMPPVEFPDDVKGFLDTIQQDYSNEAIRRISAAQKKNIANIDEFLAENKAAVSGYLEFKESDEYKESPVSKLADILKAFYQSSGYYDVLIPAMKQLSGAYSEYSRQIEIANKKLFEQYPEAGGLDGTHQ